MLDLPEGSKLSLREIKDAASNDPVYQHMSKAAQDDARAELQAYRANKASAARVSNASAAKDAISTMAVQQREVYILFLKCPADH
jgi:hypothetical protein